MEIMRIVLASKSPRRQELLGVIGIKNFEIIPAVGEEKISGETEPADIVCALASQKAEEVFAKCPDALVIAADTLVFLDGKALGKPKDEEDAYTMLKSIAGREHTVMTGVCVMVGEKKLVAAEKTKVYFKSMTDNEIWSYIKSGEPMDKAGAYGAQGLGSIFIERIDGDFFNVMGLPLCRLYGMLGDIGYKLI